MKTTRVIISGVSLVVDYAPLSDTHAEIVSVWTDSGIDDIKHLLRDDVISSIRVACVKQERKEAEFLRRCEDREAMDP